MCHEDEAALSKLYDLTVSRVFGFALRIVGDHHDAEEITCDVYAQAWRNAKRYDPQRAPVFAWLMLMTRSRGLDFLRRSASRATAMVHPLGLEHTYSRCADQAADRFALACDESSRLQEAMRALTPAQRELIGLAFFDGLSHEQLALRTGIALGTVKSHIRRGLARLKQELETGALSDDKICKRRFRRSRFAGDHTIVRST